ncbi:hypothetical protein D9758_003539 [Tetrapyrgos nigripes]|uniref:Transmembrane protein n=1 Tax=Tetrapyrgos nigripes TaxID=182062 RepID=A0A8H5GVA4_9AGAR|nr:hypothetical protein D9758_003539 [Tetrapyrgos nigripes]
MVDWQSQVEIVKDAAAFNKFMHTLFGLYIWEWFISLPFDWHYVSGKKTFRWPLIFYWLNRYSLLFALIGIVIALNVQTEIDCQSLYTFNQVFGNASIGLASINFSLRTMAVWGGKWYIVGPLVLVILGHWSLLLHGILLKAVYVPGQGCAIIDTDNTLLAATFIYSMCFDFVVLFLTAWKLVISAPSSKVMGRSKLVVLIFGDGLIYFGIAFLANLLATIFMLLNLNPVMSIIANVPSAIASTIMATRAVRRLALFTSGGPEMFSTTQASTIAFRTSSKATHVRPRVNTGIVDGVLIQMETFQSPTTPKKYVEYDAMGNIVNKDSPETVHFDPEAQEIRDEFKRPPY